MAIPTVFRPRSISRWTDPFDAMERMMQRAVEDFPVESTGQGYPVDICEEGDRLLVDAELPGFVQSEIDLSISDDFLTIQAERSSEPPRGRQHLRERHYTCVQRSFRLPSAVDPDSVEATLEGGVLHIAMKKAPSERTRKIEVK